MEICLKCARFPFCMDASANKKNCENFIKRSLESGVQLFNKRSSHA